MRLRGKVALISGGARGMGESEARLFVREGAKVVIGDILEAEGRAVEADIRAAGGDALFVRLDVTEEADWERAVSRTIQRFGRLDVLVNNAGVGAQGRIEDTTVKEWDHVMDINAKGVFLGTRAVIPAMRQAGGGSIVNISSQLGHPVRAGGHSRQLRPSRADPDRDDRAAAGRSGALPENAVADPAGPVRRVRRGRLRRPVPRLGRGGVRDRQRARHRRGLDGPVAAGLGVVSQP